MLYLLVSMARNTTRVNDSQRGQRLVADCSGAVGGSSSRRSSVSVRRRVASRDSRRRDLHFAHLAVIPSTARFVSRAAPCVFFEASYFQLLPSLAFENQLCNHIVGVTNREIDLSAYGERTATSARGAFMLNSKRCTTALFPCAAAQSTSSRRKLTQRHSICCEDTLSNKRHILPHQLKMPCQIRKRRCRQRRGERVFCSRDRARAPL